MAVLLMVLITLFLIGLVSIKVAVAVLFFGSCTAICLWINSKVKFPDECACSCKREHESVWDDLEEHFWDESYDGTIEKKPVY